MTAKPIRVRLTNRTALLSGCSDDNYLALQNYWSYAPKGLWFMPAYKATGALIRERNVNIQTLKDLRAKPKPPILRIEQLEEIVETQTNKLSKLWDGKIKFLKHNHMPAGLFRATRIEAAADCGVTFDVHRARIALPFVPGIPDSDDEQYRHQDVCVKKMQIATEKGGGTILSATGTGKTRIAAMYCSRVTSKCLFVVDQLDLLHQQREELESWLGEKVGIVGESKFEPERVTVATIQTLHIHKDKRVFKDWYSCIQVMLVDELHEQMGRRNFEVLEEIAPLVIFGLTATLQMGQKEVRYKVYAFAGPVIFEFPLEKGIKRGVLSPVVVLQLLFPEIGDGKADHHLDDIVTQVVDNEEKRNACKGIVHLLHKYGRYVVVLTNRLAQLGSITGMFKDGTYGLAYGKVPAAERRKAIDLFEKGDLRTLLANKVFKKGVNIKRVDAMIDMAEMKSKNDAAQKLGRVVRLHEDKGMALYIDIGTQSGRYAPAASSRKRAWTKMGLIVKTVKVEHAEDAVVAVEKFLKKEVLNGRETSGSLFGSH